MKNILVITDYKNNGKGNINTIQFTKQIFVNECIVQQNRLFYRKQNIDLTKFDIIFFNINEETLHFHKCELKKFKNKGNVQSFITHIANLCETNIIYNDPRKVFNMESKTKTILQHQNHKNEVIKFPIVYDLDSISNVKLPVIYKSKTGSSTCDKIIYCNEELNSLDMKKNNFFVQYIPSTFAGLFISIRFQVVNNELIDIYCRVSDEWNIHYYNPKYLEETYSSEIFFEKLIFNEKKEIQRFLDNVHEIYGNGTFSIDFVWDNINQHLYFCEIGLKLQCTHANNYKMYKYLKKKQIVKKSLGIDYVINLN